ncbi:MAG: auracyanin family protein [Reichenbachiella sp.]
MNKIILSLLILFISQSIAFANRTMVTDTTEENKYYQMVTIPIPKDIKLEVGGLAFNDQDQLGVSTRRGEVWLIDKPYSKKPIFNLFANGLHEPLGLAFSNKRFYLSQRGELTELVDKNSDGRADIFKTIYAWDLSGNYHEYSYGPKILPNGDMLVTLNVAWFRGGQSYVKWRGWLVKITPEGILEPIAAGLRSPAGYGISPEGDVFFAENQGDWVGSGRVTHLEKGDFAGHAESLKWTGEPDSPLKLGYDEIEPFSGKTLFEYAKEILAIKPPAIWFPHTLMGISTSDIVYDTSDGDFGPFTGQMFVGDQGHSKIMRVYMEKINGVYQGACFPFREGFNSGVLRMEWGSDGSMFVGMTSRGWRSTGKDMFGLQRLIWTKKIPFEIKEMRLKQDGFELEFTQPVDRKIGAEVSTYKINSFTYNYHQKYGSDIVDRQPCMIHTAEVSADGKTVKLTVHGMRQGFIHSIELPGLRNSNNKPLLHDVGYYTVNEVPGGSFSQTSMGSETASKAIDQPKKQDRMPDSWNNKSDIIITIGTKPGLKFDKEEFEVQRGSKVELIFTNNDDMLHNLVIVTPGDAVDIVGQEAIELGLDGPDMNYVPNSDLVLYHTGIAQPESVEKLYFEAPSEPGMYRYVCTFPGHSFVMRGTMIVK